MKTKNKRNYSRENGITLIALVVTIVVLLILAGVSVNALLGNSGIIKRAQDVQSTMDKAQENDEKGINELSNWMDNQVNGTTEKEIEIGSYVQYNVSYTDMYSEKEYTANDGWRYLGKDDSGNQLIVSTGVPAILYYHYNKNIGNKADGGKNAWWATQAEISATTDTLYKTSKGYDYNTDEGEPNKYAAYGLRYKFDKIPFTYQANGTSVSTANTGIFRKVANTTSGTDISLNFKAEGVNVVDVHNLTLAELNRATSKASGTTREDTSLESGFKDLEGTALGLFNMQDLTDYTQDYYYWLASPYANGRNFLYYVYYSNSSVYVNGNDFSNDIGVRPVVSLPSNVKLTVVE